jgi:hypothetical protein
MSSAWPVGCGDIGEAIGNGIPFRRQQSLQRLRLRPPEITECKTLEIKRNGEILDYTDEEIPRWKEVFLRDANGQLVDRSNHGVAFYDEKNLLQQQQFKLLL